MEFGPFPDKQTLERTMELLVSKYGLPDAVSKAPKMAVWAWHTKGLLLTAFKFLAEDNYPLTDVSLQCHEKMFSEIDTILSENGISLDIWAKNPEEIIDTDIELDEGFYDEETQDRKFGFGSDAYQSAMRFLKRNLQNKIGYPDKYLDLEDAAIAVWFKYKVVLGTRMNWKKDPPTVLIDYHAPPDVRPKIEDVLKKMNLEKEVIVDNWLKAIRHDFIDEPNYSSLGSLIFQYITLLENLVGLLKSQGMTMSKIHSENDKLLSDLESLVVGIDSLKNSLEILHQEETESNGR